MSTRWLDRPGGRIAYEDEGEGPLVVCIPGIGDLRQEYRFLTPALQKAGFRVVTMDLRGHGESTTGWGDLSPEAIGSDVTALIEQVDATSVVVIGTSMAAGAAVWAAAECADRVDGIVLVGPFVRDDGSGFQVRVTRALFRLVLQRPWGLAFWMWYWSSLFPTRKPDDFATYKATLRANLSEPGRFAALRGMMLGPPRTPIEQRLTQVQVPSLVVMGTKDRDFPDPAAEARLVAEPLRAERELVDGAGHYPHVEYPDRTAKRILDFIRTRVGSSR
jgi:pimeloyl-ACP methyl ester carboxylesterase